MEPKTTRVRREVAGIKRISEKAHDDLRMETVKRLMTEARAKLGTAQGVARLIKDDTMRENARILIQEIEAPQW